MTILFDGTLLEAVANGVAPSTGANGGPFSSFVTTAGPVVASTAQAWSGSNSMLLGPLTGAGTAYGAVCPASTPDASYQRIYANLDFYIDTIASTSTVLTLFFVQARVAAYLFNSSGWKVGFASLNNGTSNIAGGVATPTSGVVSAAVTTGAWHHVSLYYQTVDATHVILSLCVDGVVQNTGSIAPAAYTKISGSTTWRFGSFSTAPFTVNGSIGDKVYLDNMNVVDFRAPTAIPPDMLSRLSGLDHHMALSMPMAL